jgi:signal transduction histidine kinase
MRRAPDIVAERREPRLQELITAISDSAPMTRQWVGLATVVAAVATSMQDQVRNADVDLAIDGDAVLGYWDPRLIELICFCVLTHAIRSGAGQPVDLIIRGDEQEAQLVSLDRGTGFEAADADPAAGWLAGGLSAARELAGRLGGTLNVTTHPSRGTKVIVALPRRGR